MLTKAILTLIFVSALFSWSTGNPLGIYAAGVLALLLGLLYWLKWKLIGDDDTDLYVIYDSPVSPEDGGAFDTWLHSWHKEHNNWKEGE